MSRAPLQIVVPDGTAPYWLAMLQRSGLPTGTLGDGPHAATTVFLPDAAGLESKALRALVTRLRELGTPVLAGPEWGEQLGVHLPNGNPIGLSIGDAAGVRRLDPSPLLVLPIPPAARLLRCSAQLSTVPGPGQQAVREVLATADHGGLRRCIENALRALAFASGRPFARLAHAPLGFDGTFAVRIDADSYRASSTTKVLQSLERASLRSTWFVDVERHLQHGGMARVRELAKAGHEVQSHFFRHYTYRSAARNERNLQRSLDELRQVGVTATAAAAPFGSWNPGLDAALRTCGMRWSSEFSRVHDDVPGPLAGSADEPWQVPIHPVCPALLFAAGADVASVHEWFLAELQQCLQRGEPAVFYGHPIDDLERCPQLLPQLAVAAREGVHSLWQPTLGELHDFHRRRAEQSPLIAIDDSAVDGELDGIAPLVIERAGLPTVCVSGTFTVPSSELPPTEAGHGPILVPAPYRPRTQRRERLRTHRLQFARLLREIRR